MCLWHVRLCSRGSESVSRCAECATLQSFLHPSFASVYFLSFFLFFTFVLYTLILYYRIAASVSLNLECLHRPTAHRTPTIVMTRSSSYRIVRSHLGELSGTKVSQLGNRCMSRKPSEHCTCQQLLLRSVRSTSSFPSSVKH